MQCHHLIAKLAPSRIDAHKYKPIIGVETRMWRSENETYHFLVAFKQHLLKSLLFPVIIIIIFIIIIILQRLTTITNRANYFFLKRTTRIYMRERNENLRCEFNDWHGEILGRLIHVFETIYGNEQGASGKQYTTHGILAGTQHVWHLLSRILLCIIWQWGAKLKGPRSRVDKNLHSG